MFKDTLWHRALHDIVSISTVRHLDLFQVEVCLNEQREQGLYAHWYHGHISRRWCKPVEEDKEILISSLFVEFESR